jgi:hypothetical protein
LSSRLFLLTGAKTNYVVSKAPPWPGIPRLTCMRG